MASTTNQLLQLAQPGAGLPIYELWIARLLFAVRFRLNNSESIQAHFTKERALVADLVKHCPTERQVERVLISRLRGLEDSSRYWSVLMTLDHLRMVNLGCANAIRELSQGRVPAGKASTANVKPSPEVTEAVIAAYEASCQEVLAAADAARDLDGPARYAHPWFGPLSARGWYLLAAVHLGLHRKQVEAILGGFKT
jgi:hypothetical protein